MNIDLLILLEPSEQKMNKKIQIGDVFNQIRSVYYACKNSLPKEELRNEHVYQFYHYKIPSICEDHYILENIH